MEEEINKLNELADYFNRLNKRVLLFNLVSKAKAEYDTSSSYSSQFLQIFHYICFGFISNGIEVFLISFFILCFTIDTDASYSFPG